MGASIEHYANTRIWVWATNLVTIFRPQTFEERKVKKEEHHDIEDMEFEF